MSKQDYSTLKTSIRESTQQIPEDSFISSKIPDISESFSPTKQYLTPLPEDRDSIYRDIENSILAPRAKDQGL